MAGYHDFTAGEIPTAATIEDDLMLQTVMRFASAAARNTALAAVLIEGLHAFLLDTNTLTVYSGSAWSTVGPLHGQQTDWTPAITQSVAVSATVARARYTRIGRLVIGDALLNVTGAGTAGAAVQVTLPFNTASGSTNTTMGQGFITDASAGQTFHGGVDLAVASPGAIRLRNTFQNGAINYLGASGFTAALASTDVVTFQFMYEASADA
jgi:hypothetical protein